MEGSFFVSVRLRRDIPSTLGSERFSAPITCMPFGKRRLASAVEGESKQSCVIFAFYFMSVAAAVHDGRGSLNST